MGRERYENPLAHRYASAEMNHIWSPQKKFATWRRLWLALARAQQELGLDITDAQLQAMQAHLDDIDFEAAARRERVLRHDVMSHIHTFAEVAPEAQPIIHLGATSCYVGDNTDLIQLREALQLLRGKLLRLLQAFREQMLQHRALPTLGFTHYQPAQVTTVGKRLALSAQDFLLDAQAVQRLIEELPFRGVKGTTGTQASFLDLFDGDHEKVRQLDRRVAELMGFRRSIALTGQTYTRKLDFNVLAVLSGIAQSAAKFATDVRLLSNRREAEEPFEKEQVGSSAMAYKRNPMRSERICSLARYVINQAQNPADTAANQWFERTLDDSANRRLCLPEAFLGTDVILSLAHNVAGGLQVWPLVIRRNLEAELPFMATETILMAAVKAGGDRQELHEAIREHAMAGARRVKEEGADNDLLQRLRADNRFAAVHGQLDSLLDPARFVGRAPQQVEDFLAEELDPFLAAHTADAEVAVDELNV